MDPRDRRLLLFASAIAAVLLIVAFAYRPALDGPFLWDDHPLAEHRAEHYGLGVFRRQFWPESSLTDARPTYYRPLVLLSMRLDAELGGTPYEFHFTNLALHLLACVLVAILALRLGAHVIAAILAAMLWALAPRLTEAVAWISGRTDVLAVTLGLAALCLSPDTAVASTTRYAWLRTTASAMCLLGALLSKEVGFAFVAGLIIAALHARSDDRAPKKRARRWRLLVGVVLPTATYTIARLLVVGTAESGLRSLGVVGRATLVFEALGRYTAMVLDAARPRTSIGYLGEPDWTYVAFGALVVLAAATSILRQGRRISLGVAVPLAVGLTSLAMTIHVIPISLSGGVAADRLIYAPLAALAVGAAVVARPLLRHFDRRLRTVACAVTLLVATLFVLKTRERAFDYGDETRFWVVAAESAHPHNSMPRSTLAGIVRDTGQIELACRLFETSTAILEASGRSGAPAHLRTRENLAACWARAGRYEDAHRLCTELATEAPRFSRVQMELGFARLHLRDFDGARTAFEQARSLGTDLDARLRSVLDDLETARRNDVYFQEEQARHDDPFGWARHQAHLGRQPEAIEGFLAAGTDARQPFELRDRALTFVANYARLPVAEQAVATCPPVHDTDCSILRQIVARRRSSWESVGRLEHRISSLAAPRR